MAKGDDEAVLFLRPGTWKVMWEEGEDLSGIWLVSFFLVWFGAKYRGGMELVFSTIPGNTITIRRRMFIVNHYCICLTDGESEAYLLFIVRLSGLWDAVLVRLSMLYLPKKKKRFHVRRW